MFVMEAHERAGLHKRPNDVNKIRVGRPKTFNASRTALHSTSRHYERTA